MLNFTCFLAIFSISLYSCNIRVDKTISPGESPFTPYETPDLAIILIDTDGEEIEDDPKIPANMKIYSYEENVVPLLLDPPIFNGKIGIEIRGNSSINRFPKQQYGFETWDNGNNDLDVPLPGFPEESDWILSAPYSDKTLMRNHLAYTMTRQMGRYASRTKFAELYLDDDPDSSFDDGLKDFYQGVYILMEKIKRGADRVNIKKLTDEDVEEPEVTGGYIIKIDHKDPADKYFTTDKETRFIYVYPKGKNINASQEAYISKYMNDFETALSGVDFKNPTMGYAKYIDVSSFVDYFLINELLKNVDAYRFSTYMYKDRNKKLHMGPVWDFNLSTGNCNYNYGFKTEGWVFTEATITNQPYWWKRLVEDEYFRSQLASRWNGLRAKVFSLDNILGIIEDTSEVIFNAQERNFVKWDSLYKWVWPNKYFGLYDNTLGYNAWYYLIPNTWIIEFDPELAAIALDLDDHDDDGEYEGYVDEVFFLKEFIKTRIDWIDNNIEYL